MLAPVKLLVEICALSQKSFTSECLGSLLVMVDLKLMSAVLGIELILAAPMLSRYLFLTAADELDCIISSKSKSLKVLSLTLICASVDLAEISEGLKGDLASE